MHEITPLINDQAYHWHGYGDYCGRCLRDRHAPHWDLTPLLDTKGVQCRACHKLLRSSYVIDHTGLARIKALTGANQVGSAWSGANQVGSAWSDMDQGCDEYGLPPTRAGLRDPRRAWVA